MNEIQKVKNQNDLTCLFSLANNLGNMKYFVNPSEAIKKMCLILYPIAVNYLEDEMI